MAQAIKKLPAPIQAAVEKMRPETLALVRACNASPTPKTAYLRCFTECDSVFQARMLAVCMIDCDETDKAALRVAVVLTGLHEIAH